MNMCKKIKIAFFIGVLFYPVVTFFWQLRPVKIMAVSRYPEYEESYYKDSNEGFTERDSYHIAVDHLPLSVKDKVKWYIAHKTELKKQYLIPRSSSYSITVWDIGDGFIDLSISDDGDLICFPKIETAEKCIEKNIQMSVSSNEEGEEIFSFADDNDSWKLNAQGNLTDGKITFGL
ncbi:DUF943 family protein [Atlantibacter hermannii]|nr:DUF943 family protein [Atlantibacter hermannii]NBD00106.1 DUF943 family protein [Atlantibacter hermannii]